MEDHKFWSKQPVPQTSPVGMDPKDSGPIDVDKDPVNDIRQEPLGLPQGFQWCSCDVNDPDQLNEIYLLLRDNYVEDDDEMFRFDYSQRFLRWALQPPGYLQDWHLGVKLSSSGKLVGFITAIPVTISIYGREIEVAEINFLCVFNKLRSKRLAPVLIKEITRRVNVTNKFQAVYTAGITIPTPIASCRYYHRSLNPKKLIEIGFSYLKPRMTMTRMVRLYKLPDEPQVPGLRPLEERDVPQACELLMNYLREFDLYMHFNESEFLHWFLPMEGVINSYVVEKDGVITDLISFYNLPSTVIGNDKYPTLNAAYSFYNVATSTDLTQLMNDSLILAKSVGGDVFNCLDIHHNPTFLDELKFGPGDGNLQYYLYNWLCPPMEPKQMGMVLL